MKYISLVISSFLLLSQVMLAVACQSPPVPTLTPTIIPPTPTTILPTPTPTTLLPTPTPLSSTRETTTQSYLNSVLGISLSYPVDWLFRETETGVVFGTSQQIVAGGELSLGAGLAIHTNPVSDAAWHRPEELCTSQASVFASEETEISEPQARRIGGREGAVVTLQGSPGLSATPIRGLVAATIWDDWAYTFLGMSVAEEWTEYGPVLERMLDDVQFIPRETPEYTPDVWEPDDNPSEANEMEPGSPQTHDLHTQGDRDYLYFQATRGHVYTIETANLGEDIDTKIYLYDHEGNLLAQNDDGRGLQELWASRLIWTAQKTNDLYLMVQDVGDDDVGPGTSYEIRIWEEVHFVEDEFEPDDSPDKASGLEVGSAQPHNLHVLEDHDWIRFEVRAGTTYVIETFNLGPAVDTVLHLFDEQEAELAMDDNGRGDEEDLASRIRWTTQTDTYLYIMVHDLDDDTGGPGTEYRVRVLETRP